LKGLLLGSEKEWKQREDGVGVEKRGTELGYAFLDKGEGTGSLRVEDCCEQESEDGVGIGMLKLKVREKVFGFSFPFSASAFPFAPLHSLFFCRCCAVYSVVN
jgi:hypothetical protein